MLQINRWIAVWCMLWLSGRHSWSWGDPHHDITRAAIEVLGSEEKDWLGNELDALWKEYCMIPDNVFTDRSNARYAAMSSRPGEVYLKILHLPTEPVEYGAVLQYFIEQAVGATQGGRKGDAARYLGTLCHMVEDYGSPSHVLPGDNQFQLLQQFLPAPEHFGPRLLHGLIENGRLDFSIAGYKPKFLGETIAEVAWRVQHRIHEAIVNARSVTLPVVEALYLQDAARVKEHQLRAARLDAEVVADLVHTVLTVGTGRVSTEQREAVKSVALGFFWPLEAPSLYYPQSTFLSVPSWGPVTHGYVLREGLKHPLTLRVSGEAGAGAKEFGDGIAAGGRSTLTYSIPVGVFRWLEGVAGLHSEFGGAGVLEFRIVGEQGVLWERVVRGDEPCAAFRVSVEGVTRIQLTVAGKGGSSKDQYGVWGGVRLVK